MTTDYETLESRAQMLEAENARLRKLLRGAHSAVRAYMMNWGLPPPQAALDIERQIEEALK